MITLKLSLLLAAYLVTWLFLPFLRNIRAAKKTKLPYVLVPYFMYDASWLSSKFLRKQYLRVLDVLFPHQNPSPASWRQLMLSQWPLKLRHAPFTALGTDTFLTVAPGGTVLNTADANLIEQILARPNDFPKPAQIYGGISIYGKNVVSTTGSTWRRHRKVVSPAFGEKTNRLVWEETLNQSQQMLKSWTSGSNSDIRSVAKDTMRLSLTVISRAGFGQSTRWSSSTIEDTESVPAGHAMSFSDSLLYVASNVFTLSGVLRYPRSLLGQWFPPLWQDALRAYDEFESYMKEMIIRKKDDIDSETGHSSTSDVLSQLARQFEEDSSTLSDSEIIGNLFIFIVAGHETTASTLYLSILLLALHPNIQKQVQKEIADIFQGRSPSEWSYEKDLPSLFDSMLHAVLLEEHRLVSPTSTIPKVVASSPQRVTMDGKQIILPPNTMIRLCLSAAHVNPKFWPHGPPKDPHNPIFPLDNVDNDVEEFKPQRWLNPKPEYEQSSKHDTSKPQRRSSLFTPVKGSYIPFSDGQRSCIGRRFAQVEILATLAVIFSEYSVELAVGASDEAVEGMRREDRAEVWNKAADTARHAWKKELVSGITVRLYKQIPLRFVKKGEERFFNL